MAIKISLAELHKTIHTMDKDMQLFAYNATDSVVTLGVHHALSKVIEGRNDPCAATSYRFVRAMQGPAMAMMLRGVMIQQRVRQDETQRAQAARTRAQAILDRLADAVWGPEEYTEVIKSKELVAPIGKRGLPLKPRLVTTKVELPATRPRGLNAASPLQVLAFFNIALNFPVEYEIRKTAQGNERTPTANDNALRKWAKRRTKGPGIGLRDRTVDPVQIAQPFVSLILQLRDLDKQLGVLRSNLEPDGRMRCSYNVTGTKWGRWSSSKNQYGRGMNLQNVTDTMRRMFCADDGWRLISTDLEQAESRLVAGCVWQATGNREYLDSCLSGDLHTRVCMMAWPERNWVGINPNDSRNRALANEKYPNLGGLSYRDVAKRIGHGCVTPDHEVLSPNGWVPITDEPSVIMGIDEGGCGWQKVLHWTNAPYQGPMHYFKGTSLDQLVTPNHRMIYTKDRKCAVLHEVSAEDWEAKGAIPLGWGYDGFGGVTPADARLIAATQADGNIRWNGTVRFHFHKQRKFDRIEQLCKDANVKCERRGEHVVVDWVMPYPKVAGAYLLDWNADALQAYSDEHRFWDGHQGKTSISISSAIREHLEWLQTINRLIGKGGNIQKPQTSGFGTEMWTLQENNRRWADCGSMTQIIVDYNGTVHCPTVPSGMFLVRRNGKISVTGNSNYRGSAFGIAEAVGIPHWIVEEFQQRYFLAFPSIRQWHEWVREQLMTYQFLDTPLMRRCIFFDRPTEPKTLREAIAFVPQSTVAELLNLILYRVWRRSLLPPTHPHHLPIQLLLQNHDAFLLQTPESQHLPTIINAINEEFQRATVPFTRDVERLDLNIPGEFVCGYNWAKVDPDKKDFPDGNPDGLMKWVGKDDRVRQQGAKVAPSEWLQGPLPNVY